MSANPIRGPGWPPTRWRVVATVSALGLVAAALAALAAGAAASAADDQEAARIAELLQLGPGQTVADIGAGDGEWAVQLARAVNPDGKVYATEIKKDLVEKIRQAADRAGLENVSAILSGQRDAGLPTDCCDALLVRKVYHHFTDPAAMNHQLIKALKPGGLIAIIDYTSYLGKRVQGVPKNRSNHGLATEILTQEIADAGFEVENIIQPWMDDSKVYCVIARRPL
jgi:predicted methyltransferase